MSRSAPQKTMNLVAAAEADTLGATLLARSKLTPDTLAYCQFDESNGEWRDISWSQMAQEAARWRAALQQEGLNRGDRVALMLRNSVQWGCFDLAAQSLGLVTVPLYTNDRADNVDFILHHAEARVLLLGGAEEWDLLRGVLERNNTLQRILSIEPVPGTADRLTPVENWLPASAPPFAVDAIDPEDLATIVYTSGTTGRPKGVMLSHRNILWNIFTGLETVQIYADDRFLSFLPLSHTLERTVGFYLPIVTGSTVAYARSIAQLAEDLRSIRPTILIAVPRIFERIYGKIKDKLQAGPATTRFLFNTAVSVGWRQFEFDQGRGPRAPALALWPLLDKLVGAKVRQNFGGQLRFAVCGGAALAPEIARLFIGLGVHITQGYGMTEASPIISGNPLENNIPASVGTPLNRAEVRIAKQDEIHTRSPSVMLGYWRDPEATAAVLDAEGWLHTGDKGRFENGHLYITGRLKEIIVLANGEKVPPGDMEMAISLDPLFEQALVIGEGRPYLSAIIVPQREEFSALLKKLGLPPDTGYDHRRIQEVVLLRIAARLHDFPGYAKVMRAKLVDEPWTVDNGLMTPTMKLRRGRILEHYSGAVAGLYAGHG